MSLLEATTPAPKSPIKMDSPCAIIGLRKSNHPDGFGFRANKDEQNMSNLAELMPGLVGDSNERWGAECDVFREIIEDLLSAKNENEKLRCLHMSPETAVEITNLREEYGDRLIHYANEPNDYMRDLSLEFLRGRGRSTIRMTNFRWSGLGTVLKKRFDLITSMSSRFSRLKDDHARMVAMGNFHNLLEGSESRMILSIPNLAPTVKKIKKTRRPLTTDDALDMSPLFNGNDTLVIPESWNKSSDSVLLRFTRGDSDLEDTEDDAKLRLMNLTPDEVIDLHRRARIKVLRVLGDWEEIGASEDGEYPDINEKVLKNGKVPNFYQFISQREQE
ncbi:hypothetical protein JW758_05140 [Candidatus Peregrinibacteria bacterium]|nr:hypothetical protein [Candidatus Peregrinibacteria bacterium]